MPYRNSHAALFALFVAGLLLAAGCGDSAESGAEQTQQSLSSEQGLFEAEITPMPDPPVTGTNMLHLHLSDANGNAVTGATMTVEPWMPAHGHGSPETPTVADEGDGNYTVDNVVYSMPGHWEVRIDVSSEGTSDRIVADYQVQ